MLSSYLLLAITLLVGVFQIEKLFPETFKAKPWIIFALLVVLTVVSFINEHEKNKTEDDSKAAAKVDADRRDHITDSTANARVDSSNKVILNGVGQAIGKYSLGYDSAKQEIVRLQKLIKDSAKRKTIIQGENPIIAFAGNTGISMDSIKGNRLIYNITLASYSAASILKQAFAYIIVSDSDVEMNLRGLRYVSKELIASKNVRFAKDETFSQTFIFATNNIKALKTIIILLTGSYTDSRGSNIQEMNEVGIFDLQTRKFSSMVSPFDDQLRDFLKSKGVLK